MISALSLARAMGGEVSGNCVRAPGPGHSRRDRSLSIRLEPQAPDGFLVHSFAGDDPLFCRDQVRAAVGMLTSNWHNHPKVLEVVPPPQAEGNRIRAAIDLWQQAVDPTGTLVEKYLRSRGLSLLGITEIRFHGALRLEGEKLPGMVALMRRALTNEPCGVHRTFLDHSGRKLCRKMLGAAKNACVKLCDDSEVTLGLGIAEGIETALSVMGMGWRPVWACLSASSLGAFPVLPGVEALTVFADHDESGVGERAASACCTRWRSGGREAVAISPEFLGDWNDASGRVQ